MIIDEIKRYDVITYAYELNYAEHYGYCYDTRTALQYVNTTTTNWRKEPGGGAKVMKVNSFKFVMIIPWKGGLF